MPGEKLGDSNYHTGYTPYHQLDRGRGYDDIIMHNPVPVKAEFAPQAQIDERILKNGGFSRVESGLREETFSRFDSEFNGAASPWKPKGRRR